MAFSRGRAWAVSLFCVCGLRVAVSVGTGDIPVGTGADLKIKPPLPVWPSDYETITDRKPVFQLEGRYQATKYRVELTRDAAFTAPIAIADAEVTEKAGIAPVVRAKYTGEPLKDGQYYWRAFAGDGDGFWTPPANYRTFFVAAKPAAIAVPKGLAHPYLLLAESQRDAFRQRVSRSSRLGPAWQYIQNAAGCMLDATPPGEDYAQGGVGQHGNYSTAATWYSRHLGNVAFVALVNGDEKLGAKGVEMLMTACSYQRWLGPFFDDKKHFDPPWNSSLETAMMTTAVATGYDLLYPRLTDEQRAAVRQALIEKGIKPLVNDWADPFTMSRLPRHQVPTGNWAMVCAGSAGVGALAILGEEPKAAEWVRLVRDRVRAWLLDRGGDWYVDNPYAGGRPTPIPVVGPSDPNFDRDGGYKESISYMNYAMNYVCCFADALYRTTGENLFDEFPRKSKVTPAGANEVASTLDVPTSQPARRSDRDNIGTAGRDTLLDVAAWSALGWREAGEVKSEVIPFGDCHTSAALPYLYAAMTRYRKDVTAAWLTERVSPIPRLTRELVWLDELVSGSPPDTALPMAVFHGIGQVVMRSGWGPDTPAAAIKFCQNRGHLDIGNFYLFGGGHPTLIDSGSFNYGTPIYDTYLSQSIAHNLVLVDNKPQVRADGQLLAAVGTSRLTAASGQLAAAYPDALKSWTRDLLMLPGGLAIVLDRLEGKGPHRFDYILHPYWPFKLPLPNAAPGELLVGEGDKPTRLDLYTEASFTVSQQDGYFQGTPRKYVRFDSAEPAESRTYLMVCQWPAAGALKRLPVEVSAIGQGRWQVRRVNEDWRLMIRTGADASAGDSLDARLVAVWDQGEKSRERHALVLAARRLGVDNRELMRATRPVSAAIEFGRPLWAQFWATEPARVTLTLDPGLDYVFLNGAPLDVVRRGSTITFNVPAGECTLLASEAARFIDRPPSIVSDDLLRVPAPTSAPAFDPGATVRMSSCIAEGLLAIDGDANTGWVSLPGRPMPQWIEVKLTAPRKVGWVRVGTGQSAKGHVELWDRSKNDYVQAGKFTTTPDAAGVVQCAVVQTNRIRVVIDRLDSAGTSAVINTLEWREKP